MAIAGRRGGADQSDATKPLIAVDPITSGPAAGFDAQVVKLGYGPVGDLTMVELNAGALPSRLQGTRRGDAPAADSDGLVKDLWIGRTGAPVIGGNQGPGDDESVVTVGLVDATSSGGSVRPMATAEHVLDESTGKWVRARGDSGGIWIKGKFGAVPTVTNAIGTGFVGADGRTGTADFKTDAAGQAPASVAGYYFNEVTGLWDRARGTTAGMQVQGPSPAGSAVDIGNPVPIGARRPNFMDRTDTLVAQPLFDGITIDPAYGGHPALLTAAVNVVYNGTSGDMVRGDAAGGMRVQPPPTNVPQLVLATSAVRTAQFNTPLQTTPDWARGVIVYVDCSVTGTGSLNCYFAGKDPVGGTEYQWGHGVNIPNAGGAANRRACIVYPGGVEDGSSEARVSFNGPLPYQWLFKVAPTDGSNWTYTIHAHYIT